MMAVLAQAVHPGLPFWRPFGRVCCFGCLRGYRQGSFKRDKDLDVEVDVDTDSHLGGLRGISESVQVQLNGP